MSKKPKKPDQTETPPEKTVAAPLAAPAAVEQPTVDEQRELHAARIRQENLPS